MSYRIYSFENLSLSEQTECFNRSFEDYVISVQLTESQMEKREKKEKLRLDLSLACEIDSQLAGICLNGRNGPLAYCGGFGIYKPFRGQGFGKRFFIDVLSFLRENGIKEYQLEVICENTAAYLLYKGLNFLDFDQVYVLEGRFRENDDCFRREDDPPVSYLQMLEKCSFDRSERVWGCSPYVLSDLSGIQAMLLKASAPIGGIAYTELEDTLCIRDLRVKADCEENAFASLNRIFSGRKATFYFAHQSQPIIRRFLDSEWQILHRQFAMRRFL